MCNEYQEEFDFGAGFNRTGRTMNRPFSRHPFPDAVGRVVRMVEGEPTWEAMRWGFPPLKPGMPVVTNVRNVSSNFWKGWLKNPEFRCLVPWTKFCEWEQTTPKRRRWFSMTDAPGAYFAGIWRPWTGTRGTKKEPETGEHLLYSFLTTDPNNVVGPIHPKAMPVILTSTEERETWLTAPVEEALKLQRPLPDEQLMLLPVE